MKTEQWQWSASKGWKPGVLSETATLGTSAQTVLLFGSTSDLEAGRCFDVVRTVYPNAHIFGCTTGGEIYGTRVTDSTVTVTAIAFEHGHVAAAHVHIPSIDRSFEAIRFSKIADHDGGGHVSSLRWFASRHYPYLC